MGKRKAGALPEEIQQEPTGSSGAAPLAIYFPSGFDPNKHSDECAWTTYAHQDKKSQFTVVAATDHNVDFVGTSFGAEYSNASACRFALGVFDRDSGRLEVTPLAAGAIMRMEPQVHGLSYAPAEAPEEEAAEQRKEQNLRLVEEFGSQRRRRQLLAREGAQVQASHVSGGGKVMGMLADAGAAAGGATKEDVIQAALAQRNIPPHHPEASSAEEAYRYGEIVPPSVRDGLEGAALLAAAKDPAQARELQEGGQFGAGYVLSRLPATLGVAAGAEAQRAQRAVMLALLGHLLKLYGRGGGLRGRSMAELAEKCLMAQSVAEGLLALFYTAEGDDPGAPPRFALSNDRRALMLSWILVLAVRAEAAAMLEPPAFTALAAELKLRPSDLVARFRELGCVDIGVSTTSPEGAKGRSYKISLLPPSPEAKTLKDYFPALKLGPKKR